MLPKAHLLRIFVVQITVVTKEPFCGLRQGWGGHGISGLESVHYEDAVGWILSKEKTILWDGLQPKSRYSTVRLRFLVNIFMSTNVHVGLA